MPVPLLDLVAQTTQACVPILGQADDWIEDRDPEVDVLAPSVAHLHVATRELVNARSGIDTLFARRLSGDEYVGDGYVIRRRGGTTRRSWDDARLWPSVRNHIERAIGRMFPDDAFAEQHANRTLGLVAEVVNVSGRNMRVRKLREWGINPDSYADVETGGYRLEVL